MNPGLDGKIYLGLGSNTGNSRRIIGAAVQELSERLSGVESSSIYVSKARYVEDQPDFINCAVKADMPPCDALCFLGVCQDIEARWGRDRSRERPKGERSLDIDILLWGKEVITLPRLVVPHPGIRERKFVLLPLLELYPGLEGPDGLGSYLDSLDALPEQGIYYASLSEYASIVP